MNIAHVHRNVKPLGVGLQNSLRANDYGVGVAVLSGSGSGTGVGSGVAVGTGVGSGSGVGIGAGVAKIPSGSRSRRYIAQCSLMFRAGSSVKQTHAHFSGKQRSRCCGCAIRASGEQ